MIEYFNEDCMVGMARYPDKYFDLAIVDPPYGINIVDQFKKTIKSSSSMFNKSKGIYGSNWDCNIPDKLYFDELMRISKNQIIWGGNYFNLGSARCYLIWDKMNGTNPMADAELAWTSIDGSVRIFRMHHFSAGYDAKMHPTQKPVALYKWLLTNYAKKGDKILDTHVGSASSLIACHDMGFDAVGFELDPDYYAKSKQRLEDFMRQPRIDTIEQHPLEQMAL